MKRILFLCLMLIISHPLIGAEMGDDGLHKAAWMRDTFKDLSEDLEEANAEGKRLAVIIEQRNCMYCKKMHETVFSDPAVFSYLMDNFFVVQINMFGNVEVTDFDGEILEERDMVSKWGMLFTPTMMFFPEDVSDAQSANRVMVASMPGAFGKETTKNLLSWVIDKEYETPGASFQKYHADKYNARQSSQSD